MHILFAQGLGRSKCVALPLQVGCLILGDAKFPFFYVLQNVQSLVPCIGWVQGRAQNVQGFFLIKKWSYLCEKVRGGGEYAAYPLQGP